MQCQYVTCDVFTIDRFSGNPLAVVPDAKGLSTEQMQQIAREFNYSESTFVLPSEDALGFGLRIFTPTVEIPFAGHPNIGTAFVLASKGYLGEIGDAMTIRFEEAAGPVPVTISRDREDRILCELQAPQPLALGETVEPRQMARVLSLDLGDIVTTTHGPQVAGVGLPFLFVELASRTALRRASVNITALAELRDAGVVPDVHVYVRSTDEFDIRARMFAPFDGVPEDPATGSANCALVALLSQLGGNPGDGKNWRIAQGVEMGRPSMLFARVQKGNGAARVWMSGHCVLVTEGVIEVE